MFSKLSFYYTFAPYKVIKIQIMKNVKKTIKKSILIVTVFASMLTSATEISKLKLVKEELTKTALTLNNVKAGNLLTIKDYSGVILYKELINSSGTYKKGFDLTALPNGAYFFEVDKDLEILTIPFTVNANKVAYNKETTAFKPLVNQKNNLVFISKLSPNLEAVNIRIYADNNNDYELLYSEKIEGVQTVERIYKLEKGKYKIVFNSNNQEFTKFINN